MSVFNRIKNRKADEEVVLTVEEVEFLIEGTAIFVEQYGTVEHKLLMASCYLTMVEATRTDNQKLWKQGWDAMNTLAAIVLEQSPYAEMAGMFGTENIPGRVIDPANN